ncbi:MAG: phosphoglucosamine mutase [Candidatus Woesearchaeota archaeon]
MRIFGTDGIRGKANYYPMTPELSLQLGKALAYVFNETKNGNPPAFVIGKDTRVSGYLFENALTAGLVSMGADVILVGPMPTPAVAHLTKSFNANAGIVISASHNPAEDNGIKIFSAEGIKLPDEMEIKIEKLLGTEIKPNNGNIGKAYRMEDARGRYIEFAKSTVNNISLVGMTIVLDCANGAAYNVAPKIFTELGAHVIVLNNTPDGYNINNNCGALHPENVSREVINSKANIGIALDGDADRVILLDEKGAIVDGDQILVIAGLHMLQNKELNSNTIVATEYSNLALDHAIGKAHGKVVRVENGDRYVIEEMLKHNYNLGGEQSGHIIFFNHTKTGDGTIAALNILKIMQETGKPLSQLAKLEKYPQITKNVEVDQKKPFDQMPEFSKKLEQAKQELSGKGRLLIRYSGTQNILRIMVEGPQKQIITIVDELVKAAEASK